MMNKVSFHTIKVDHDHTKTDQDEMEVVHIQLNPTTVGSFPAHDKMQDSDSTYAEFYGGEYQAFKDGVQPPANDAEYIEQLKADLADRDARIADLEAARNKVHADSDYQDPNPPHMQDIKSEQQDAIVS